MHMLHFTWRSDGGTRKTVQPGPEPDGRVCGSAGLAGPSCGLAGVPVPERMLVQVAELCILGGAQPRGTGLDKRYQVFISSTFQDLQNARQEVSQALLRADCFPAGMELFPAADEEQLAFIKTVIDQSDYYIIISAGRYGSIHPETGLSYTEMEYDYAVETGKPVIRLLHKDPKSIADEGDEKLAKLLNFRTKMRKSRMVAFWSTPDELGKEVVYALLDTKKNSPEGGWVRTGSVATSEAMTEIADLRRQVAELELAAEQSQSNPEAIDALVETYSDIVKITTYFRSQIPAGSQDANHDNKSDDLLDKKTVDVSFSEILRTCALSCFHASEHRSVVSRFESFLQNVVKKQFPEEARDIIAGNYKDVVTTALYKLEALGILESRTIEREPRSLQSRVGVGSTPRSKVNVVVWVVQEKARIWASGQLAELMLNSILD